nr:immunoglobulin light chain junction region [Macaca mulatta]
CLLYVIGARVF